MAININTCFTLTSSKVKFSPKTHKIILDKNYSNLHWYLLADKYLNLQPKTKLSFKNFIWAKAEDVEPYLNEFNDFVNEKQKEFQSAKDIMENKQKMISLMEQKDEQIENLKKEKYQLSLKLTDNKSERNSERDNSERLANSNILINNSIPMSKYEKLLNEYSDLENKNNELKKMVGELKKEKKEFSKLIDGDIPAIDEKVAKTLFLDTDLVCDMENIENGKLKKVFEQLQALMSFLIYNIQLNDKNKKVIIEICSIIGMNEEDTKKIFRDAEKMKGKMGFFKK